MKIMTAKICRHVLGLRQQNLIGLLHQIYWCRNGNETESTYFLHQCFLKQASKLYIN